MSGRMKLNCSSLDNEFHTYIMASKNDAKWHQNYEALKAYILERGHLPDKHVVENRALLNWAKYNRKKIKAGTLEADKVQLFEALLALRTNEHTGGSKPKNTSLRSTDS